MEIRKEQVVLLCTAALIGWLAYGSLASSNKRAAQIKRAPAPPLVHARVSDPALVLPEDRELNARSVRELFSPPSDTQPLPPLELVPPPQVPLAVLRPPPEPGPAPKLYGRFLRVEPSIVPVAGLFVPDEEAAPESVEDEDTSAAARATPDAVTKVELSPQERAERVASNKKLYDWVRTVELKFGQIVNRERYSLARRAGEDIQFIEFNPATGKPRLPGQAPIPLARANVAEFGFADTVQNQIELRRAEFGDPLPMAEYESAVAFGLWCIDQHLETPRALEIAEEIFTRAAALAREDPLPRLGLARCYEAGFEFERAFQEYHALMGGAYARNPLVLVRLAALEARFRMFDRAEERMREAERYGRTSWVVQATLGRFLLDRGRPAEALEHLRIANQHEPTGPEFKHERALIRAGLGRALLATGEIAEGAEWFEKARQADPGDQTAQAGLVCAAVLGGGRTGGALNGSSVPVEKSSVLSESAGFELLLASGLESLFAHDPAARARAEQSLRLAANADPLRASLAWRALSFLAETTGYPEDALRLIELALENDPTDAWALYQRGRLLSARDDLDGATESFMRALDVELDLPDALAALGEVAHRRGDFAAAERYLERALALEPKLASVGALRGTNFLELGALRDAEQAFRQALSVEPDHPSARNGLAWCFYARGDATEALTRFRELDDNRRAQAENDSHREYARAQIARISDHLEKVAWSDHFERRSLLNGWDTEEKTGPQVSIHDGKVTLAGAFKSNGRARLWQLKSAGSFVAFEARLTVKAGTTARVGLFVSRETSRAGESQVEAEVTVSRHNDPGKNTIQTRAMKRGEEELAHTDVPGFEWKLDQPIVVRIERVGDSSDTRVRLLVDGFPVLENKAMPNLGRTNAELRLGIFAEGQTGRQVQLDIDDVEIVYREKS